MSAYTIHPLAAVEEGATIGEGVIVEPFAVVKAGVVLERGVTIGSHAYIAGNTHIGEESQISPYASIGTPPQAVRYRGETTYVKIGKRCQVREHVTINSSLGAETAVEIGDDCFLMTGCHIAHNCRLGQGVVMANNATLAGHVDIGDHAIIGGMTPIHQFVRVGKYAMVGGFSRVPQDVPPYTLGAGVPYRFGGLNLRGLKRHGFPMETRNAIYRAFCLIFRSSHPLEAALKILEEDLDAPPEVRELIEFCRSSKRGIICSNTHHKSPHRIAQGSEE